MLTEVKEIKGNLIKIQPVKTNQSRSSILPSVCTLPGFLPLDPNLFCGGLICGAALLCEAFQVNHSLGMQYLTLGPPEELASGQTLVPWELEQRHSAQNGTKNHSLNSYEWTMRYMSGQHHDALAPAVSALRTPSLALSPRLQRSGIISAYYNLRVLDSNNSPTSASRVAGIKGTCHHAWLIFVFLVHMTFCHHFGRLRKVDHLRSGVRDQPGQHSETPSLLKIQKLAGFGGSQLHTHTRAQGLTLPPPRLECSDKITAHCDLNLLGSGDSPASASLVVAIFNFFLWRWGSHYVAQAGLKLLGSSDPPALASQSAGIIRKRRGITMLDQAGLKLLTSSNLPASASQSVGITGMSHHAWPHHQF
ncbi:hypothetical protein AAY473_032618 [Plecturocebus cupreus]